MTLFIAFYALNETDTFPRFAHRVSGTCAMYSSLHRNQRLIHLHHYWLPHFWQINFLFIALFDSSKIKFILISE